MRIAINAVSSTAGGGHSYLLNLARTLPPLAPHQYLLYAPASVAPSLAPLLGPAFEIAAGPPPEAGYLSRLLWEQMSLPRELRRWKADVLISAGNFCPLRSPVPVVLMSRNALYFTPRYLGDLAGRGHWAWAARHLLMTRLAVLSARAARVNVTPTAAMGELVRGAAGGSLAAPRTIPFGFQPWPALNGSGPAPPPPFRLLIVSHYNYFRSFETALEALARLRAHGHDLRLTLSTRLEPGLRLGGYDTTGAYRLLHRLGLADAVTLLGAVPYDELPRLYASAHAVLCPSYAESFGQTVLEAMAMGVPVIASAIPAHREVAGDAALFFTAGDPEDLARVCAGLLADPALQAALHARGRKRAEAFTWRRHFEDLLAAAAEAARS